MSTTTEIGRRVRAAAVLLAGGLALMSSVGSAEASTYNVRQCWSAGGNPSAPDGASETSSGGAGHGYAFHNLCAGSKPWRTVQIGGFNFRDQYGRYVFDAPPGTRFSSATFNYSYANGSGYRGSVSYRPVAGSEVVHPTSPTSGAQTTISNADRFGVALTCVRPSCPGDGIKAQARIGDVRMKMDDQTPPAEPRLGGSLLDGGWVSGSESLSVVGEDSGAGVDRITLRVNDGTESLLRDYCDPPVVLGWTFRARPCDPSVGYEGGGFETGAAPFREGEGNLVEVCVYEWGSGPQRSCASRTVRVDNVAPTTPLGLEVSQGHGWQRVNSFDLEWSNPDQEHAPIDGAHVRVTGSGYDSGWTWHPGEERESLPDLRVPGPGAYTVQVAVRDAAGNWTATNAGLTTVRFDDVAPGESPLEAPDGWIGRAELEAGFLQSWSRPAEPHPLSGIGGYAFVADRAPNTDPCDPAGVGGAGTECDASEVNFPGIDNRSITLGHADLGEGSNWVHVVPVSGSGVKADRIQHARLQVDTIDPATSLSGAPGGWSREPVDVTAVATDERSGMADTGEYPGDAPPATFIEVDGLVTSEPGDEAGQAVAGDGVHVVRFWARDLAGNTAEPGTAEVAIDGTAPTAYLEPRDPGDPDLISARVADATSGVAAAQLHYREPGRGWVQLDSSLEGDRVTARLDSAAMKEGATYRFRVTAHDRAGNVRQSTRLEDGTERTQRGPLRDRAEIVGMLLDGKRRAKVAYGKRAHATGRLIDESGRGIGGARVEVTESFAPGSAKGQRASEVVTDAGGRFSLLLARGPSRSVSAAFEGDRRRLGARSRGARRLTVRGRITLRATHRKVRPGRTTRFKGRVGRAAARIPHGGKLVEVQVRIGNRWQAVDRAIRTRRNGSFALRYRFGRFYTQPTTFTFRAVALQESAWPYRPSKSPKRKVTIVP